jgi:hypothetical protein
MDIGTFSNINLMFGLYKATECLEESNDITQLCTNYQFILFKIVLNFFLKSIIHQLF